MPSTDAAPTAEQPLDVIAGLIMNGYGPVDILAAAVIAADPRVHGATPDSLDAYDNDFDGGPIGLYDAVVGLIGDGYVATGPDGRLSLRPYEGG